MRNVTKLDDRLEYEAVGRLASVKRLATIYGSFGNWDTQTGWPNRRSFQRYLAAARLEPPHHLGLLILDIDHLRLFNDLHGREAGDAVITSLAEKLSDGLDDATVFRIGSDEFAIVLDGCSSQRDVDDVATRIRELVSGPSTLAGRVEFPSVTIGGAVSMAGCHSACKFDPVAGGIGVQN